jgi:hypothetical protein
VIFVRKIVFLCFQISENIYPFVFVWFCLVHLCFSLLCLVINVVSAKTVLHLYMLFVFKDKFVGASGFCNLVFV